MDLKKNRVKFIIYLLINIFLFSNICLTQNKWNNINTMEGDTLLNSRNYEAASEIYLNILKNESPNVYVYITNKILADSLFEIKNYEDASKIYLNLINYKFIDLFFPVHINKTRVSDEGDYLANPNSAEDNQLIILQGKSNDSLKIFYKLGYCLFEIKKFIASIEKSNHLSLMYYRLGYCFLKDEKYELASRYLEKSYKLNPYTENNNLCLAIVYDKLKNINKAIYFYKQAMETSQDYDDEGNLIDSIKSTYEKLKDLRETLIEYANIGRSLYIDLCYDTKDNVYNVDFNKVYKIKEYFEKCLEYKSLFKDINFEGIIDQMNTLIKLRDKNPELYKK